MEIITNLLGLGTTEESCGKLVVFCYHHSVFDLLKAKLKDLGVPTACLSGKSSDKARQEAVRLFQKGDAQVFLGTFAAAEGITLTAANICLFVEMSWTLSQNEQAPDRLHRIGQKNTVYIKYLLLDNSLDITVYNCYKRKGGDKKKLLEENES
jgi:SNF2 family DNA or RNA helicase